MGTNRPSKLEEYRAQKLSFRIVLILVVALLIAFVLVGRITVAECIAIGVALVSIFIVWGQHIAQLKREHEETEWYQTHLLSALNELVEWTLEYIAGEHGDQKRIEKIHDILEMDNHMEYDGEHVRNVLKTIHENFQIDMTVLQSNYYIQPDIRDFVSDFRRIIRPFFTFDYDENFLLIMSVHIGELLELDWWVKDDDIKEEHDTLAKLNTMLDEMIKELGLSDLDDIHQMKS